MTNCMEAAMRYVARGWAVLPLHRLEHGSCSCGGLEDCRPGKHAVGYLCRGVDEATLDPGTVAQWWSSAPWNIGIACRPSGLLVLDVDPKTGGDRELVDLVLEHGPIGDTLHSFTGGAGDHFYFRAPASRVRSGSKALGAGLDVITGGYVVAPPSLHASGRRYHWPHGIDTAPILDLPPWLLGLLTPPATVACAAPVRVPADVYERARRYLAAVPPAVSGQAGHRALLLATLALVRGFALSDDAALSLLRTDYSPQCSPPWDERDLVRKVRSARESTSTGYGYLLTARAAVGARY